MSDDELISALNKEKLLARQYDIKQQCKKIALNSMYGSLGNEYSRWFDVGIAEAITLSGQLSIQWIGEALNRYLNKLFKTEGQDYVIASDTDSVYLRLGDAVKQGFKTTPEPQKAVEFLDKFCERVLQPFIEKEFTLLANIMNAYSNKMFMGREVIAQKGVWTAKKRYMLSVWNSEGVQYKTPKFKIMGIETTRSSTPAYVRKALKKAVEMVLLKDESTLQEFVKTTREEFKGLPPEAMAFPRSVNGMGEYKDLKTVYRKSTPIAVKAALLHNQLVHSKGLGKKYRSIGEGEKIKFIYLRTPNPIHEHVIGFTSSLPPEFELQKYVDWELQFDKSFLEPLRSITNSVGWKTEQENTLESLFV
jgi:DNA polymerase elongation subunit (family B)